MVHIKFIIQLNPVDGMVQIEIMKKADFRKEDNMVHFEIHLFLNQFIRNKRNRGMGT